MFMYKEDVDMTYRLQWAGWKSHFAPQAVSYHDRTVPSLGRGALDMLRNRRKKAKLVNQVSYLNHQILLQKNFSSDFSTGVRGATFWYNFKVFWYLLVFETELLGQWWRLFRLRRKIDQRRSSMPRRVESKEIEKFMEN
jgi:GT2 family glycosyltransferase